MRTESDTPSPLIPQFHTSPKNGKGKREANNPPEGPAEVRRRERKKTEHAKEGGATPGAGATLQRLVRDTHNPDRRRGDVQTHGGRAREAREWHLAVALATLEKAVERWNRSTTMETANTNFPRTRGRPEGNTGWNPQECPAS